MAVPINRSAHWLKLPSALTVTTFAALIVALLAWWPLLGARPWIADDFFNGPLCERGFAAYWQKFGIWRMAGHPPPFLARVFIPGGNAWLALFTHLITVVLFVVALGRIGGPAMLRAAIALFLAATPFGFQALTWDSAFSFAFATALSLALFSLTGAWPITIGDAVRRGLFAAAVAFLALMASEATLLLIGWIAIAPIFRAFDQRSKEGGRTILRAAALEAAIILATVIAWLVLQQLTKPPEFHKAISLNPRPFLSGLFYQHRQITYFVNLPAIHPWLHAGAWISAAAAAVVALVVARSTRDEPGRSRPGIGEILWFAGLPLFAVGIYSLSGGFSTDARKAYVLWPFFLLTAAFFLGLASTPIYRIAMIVCFALVPVVTLASHGVTRVWQENAVRFHGAYDMIRGASLSPPFSFVQEPDPYRLWPDFDHLCGFRFDTPWVVECAVGKRSERSDGGTTVLIRDGATGAWRVDAVTKP